MRGWAESYTRSSEWAVAHCRNPGVPTIEGDLLDAMCKASAFPPSMKKDLAQVSLSTCMAGYTLPLCVLYVMSSPAEIPTLCSYRQRRICCTTTGIHKDKYFWLLLKICADNVMIDAIHGSTGESCDSNKCPLAASD